MYGEIKNHVLECINTIVEIEETEVLFGVHDIEDKNLSEALDFLILEAKWQIWKNRNCVKYGKKQPQPCKGIVNKIINSCKEKLNMAEIQNNKTLLQLF